MRKNFSGKPSPDVEWLDTNGRSIITKSDRFKVTTVDRLTTLTILRVDNDVQGKYLLKVKNDLGEAKCEIPVEVLEHPIVPDRPILEKQKFNSVSLKWNAVSEDASKKVQYIVEMKKEGEEEWVKAIESVQLNVTVKELEPGNTYRFRVLASIADNLSKPSEESESFFVEYKELEKKKQKQAEGQEKEINYDEVITDVKSSEYHDIDVLKLPNDFESKYILCEKIGVGAYGTVYRAIERATGKNWAAKVINICPDMKKEMIMHEVNIMNELHHEKLLNLHEVFDLGKEMCLIEEFISGGDLHDKIIDDKALMSENEVRTFIRQILQGVQYMHNNGIVHLDLKPENIMLTSNKSNDIKIIDFGLAQKLDTGKSTKLLFCTAEFCPPEVINMEPVGLSADMWSVGVIAYTLLSNASPFMGTTNQETMANVSSGDWQFKDVVWDDVSDLAKDFISKLIVKNKGKRMTAAEALVHPWITMGELKTGRGKVPLAENEDFFIRKRLSNVLVPIGKLVKTGAIFRHHSMDGTFERDISFEANFAPRLLQNLEDIVANVGDLTASLICKIEALPQPVIQWLKDGKKICIEVDKYEVKYEGCIIELNIKNIVNEDSGLYSVIATNDLGSIRSEAKVSVEKAKKKKVKKIIPKEIDKEEIKEATLKDTDAGAKERTREERERPDGVIAEEVYDETKNELLEGQPQIVVPLSNEITAAGQQLILSCEIKSSSKSVVSWFRNDERLAPTGRYEMLEQDNIYKLICHTAQSDDSATYRCVATNPIGTVQSTCQVTVVASTSHMAPKFEVPLKDQTALANKEVKLKCRVSGDPQPQITWMKDGATINTTRRQKLEFTEDGLCSLTIFNCTAKDTGFYQCTASNMLGSESSHMMLTVAEIAGPDSHLVTAENKKMQYCKPRFTRVPGTVVETTEGSTVKLISRAVGLPNPLIKWFKDGKEITKMNRAYEILLTGEGESVLLISYAVTKTAGIFKCVAENSEGTTSFETELIVHTLLHKQHQEEQAPSFTMDLTDVGVAIGHPVTLKCHVKGIPEPQLKWIFINDSQQTSMLRTTIDSAWLEYRQGGACEMRTESVVKTQQGTYQCVASNEHGRAMTQCYLLVGEPFDEPAGPPRFLKCMRDIWAPLGEDVEFEVEVSGYPLPELTWYHLDEKILEEKNVQISHITPTKCQLKIASLSVSHLGTYSVEASNIHGIVRTTASLNVGKKHSTVEPLKLPEDSKAEAKLTTNLSHPPSSEILGLPTPGMHRSGAQRLDIKRKGAAPAFLIGLEDLEFREGDAAALAGTVAKKRRHRIHGRSDGKRIKQIITLRDAEIDASASSSSIEPQTEITTLEEIRASIAKRNKNICRPKFMVKPKPKKSIVEHKSLRLKTAISANPIPLVHWDKAGVVLETGNKYSIYNDGDFYYLEVHHMSKIDEGFYNCSASNSEGFVTCTAEIEVIPGDGTRRLRKVPAAPSFIEVLPGKFKATNGDSVSIECSVSGYPAPAIQWLRNGAVLIPEHDRYLISYDGETTTLKFISIVASDAGKYVCIAKNQEGEAKTAMQLDVELRKISPTGGIPPKFRIDGRRERIKAIDGDKVVLLAELLEGSEPLTVRWIRNEMEIQDSSGFGYSRDEANCYLTIADAFPEDAGVYTCEARNEFGIAKCNIHLIVTEDKKQSGYENPPVIVNAPTSASVEQGNDLTLSVTVRGYPEPAVIWTKNMVSIASGEKYQMTNSGEMFTLTIRNCTNEDRGKYELQAVNLAGTAQAIIAVDITEVTDLDAVMPRFTKLPISIQSTIGQKASLTCSFKGLQSTVTWFHDDKKLVSGRHGIEISSTATTSTLSILQLTDQHLGEYLCAVRNEYGEDLAKAVIFLEGSSVALPSVNGY